MERFLAAEPVGEEAIGVLFGRSEDGPRIVAWRAIDREAPGTAAVPLTPADESALRALAATTMDGATPIGLFRSRTRGMAALSPEDVSACQKIFDGRECLAVVLRPSTQRPVVASFSFVVPGAEVGASQRGVRVSLSPVEDKREAEVTRDDATSAPVASNEIAVPSRRRWLKPAIGFGGGLAVSSLAMLLFLDRPLRLRVDLEGQTLRVQWNRSAGFLTRPDSASLRVGGRAISLSQSQMRQGRWNGPAPKGDFPVSLHLHGGLGGPYWAGMTVIRTAGSSE